MTDTVSDCLTRLRNGARARKANVSMPHSKLKEAVVGVLKQEGFIENFEVRRESGKAPVLEVTLRYGTGRASAIQGLRRVSRPGRRVYRASREFKPVLGGLGFSIVSTSKGVITDAEARRQNVGGEILCEVW